MLTWTSVGWSNFGGYFSIPWTILYKLHTVTGYLPAEAESLGCPHRPPMVFGPGGESRFRSDRSVITKLDSKIRARDPDTAEPPCPCTYSCMRDS